MRYYDIEVAGTKRALKLCPINQDLCIAAFLILGDTELTVNCAAALLERAPKYDFLLTAEAKSIPLVQEMARQNGDAHYIVARKNIYASAYELYLPDKALLQSKVKEWIEEFEEYEPDAENTNKE